MISFVLSVGADGRPLPPRSLELRVATEFSCECHSVTIMTVDFVLSGTPFYSVHETIVFPGPDLYYYEVIECGRRILLTGVLIFIDPYTPTQAAAACIFAFASLLGFELLQPHLDPTDALLYRLVSITSHNFY